KTGSSVGSSSVMKELKFTMPSLVHSPKKKTHPSASQTFESDRQRAFALAQELQATPDRFLCYGS
ncbi:Glycerol3phosphate acyltransferase_ mitochondrial, partial [Caligus rogercresseyi]